MDMQTNPTTNSPASDNKVPEPPALEIDIRTMESDMKAFREGGGEVPSQGVQEAFASQRNEPAAPAYGGPEKPLFETPVAPAAPAPMPQAPARPTLEPVSSGHGKTIAITIGIIIGIIALGLLGYFVVFPQLFKLIG